MRTALVIAGFVLLTNIAHSAFSGSPPASPHTAADVRKSVERALPFIETEGVAWMKERKCMSCHVVPFMVWSFREASAAGVPINDKKLADWTLWCANDSLKHRTWFKLAEPNPKEKIDPYPEAVQAKLKPMFGKGFGAEKELLAELGKILNAEELKEHQGLLVKRGALPPRGGVNDGGSVESISQMLLGWESELNRLCNGKRDLSKAAAYELKVEEIEAMRELEKDGSETVLKWQEADGSWKAGGQLPAQNRPRTEANEVSTAWTLLALGGLYKTDAKVRRAIESGLAFVRKSKPGKSHESLLMHMLIEKRFGRPGEAEPFLKEVLARQNADGGWSWLSGGKSDAFATGQSLYALSLFGLKPSAAPLQRAQKYLLETQSKEGIWEVPPQAISDTKAEGRLRRLVPIYHFWGTTWAVIGLSRSLGEDR